MRQCLGHQQFHPLSPFFTHFHHNHLSRLIHRHHWALVRNVWHGNADQLHQSVCVLLHFTHFCITRQIQYMGKSKIWRQRLNTRSAGDVSENCRRPSSAIRDRPRDPSPKPQRWSPFKRPLPNTQAQSTTSAPAVKDGGLGGGRAMRQRIWARIRPRVTGAWRGQGGGNTAHIPLPCQQGLRPEEGPPKNRW